MNGEDTPRWEIVEHTADAGVRGRGESFPSLVAALAGGLFEVIAGGDAVRPQVTRTLLIDGETPEDLLHDALEALNTLHQVHGELYGAFRVEEVEGGLRIEATGEPIDPSRHDLRTEVKAVTWHDLTVETGAEGWRGEVLLDL